MKTLKTFLVTERDDSVQLELLDVFPTNDDLMQNIKYRISAHLNVENPIVSYVNRVLTVETVDSFDTEGQNKQCLLKAIILNSYFKEVYGRFKDVGLNPYEVMYLLADN